MSVWNKEIEQVVLNKAPHNAMYASPDIQKEILSCLANQVKRFIREDIGDSKFCILVDEARDRSRKEQMALVIRYVDKNGIVRERFFVLFYVLNTTTQTLKAGIYSMLSSNNLSVKNIRGQCYDGASNTRGSMNGLQALISIDSLCAYYVHFMAHRLQLALVATAQEITFVHTFFNDLNFIIGIHLASCKRSDQLKAVKASKNKELLESGELESGTGKNQISGMQRPGDTCWSLHYKSVSSILELFISTCSVLINITEE